jgi:acetylornithine deacetylase/succinyl-diaminopimelate desuccinylase-like protein
MRRLTEAGIDAKMLEPQLGRGNLVARLRGDGSKKPLLLIAHIDTAPADGAKWSSSPFSLTEKDGFLYGRGVGGDKALAAAYSAVVLELKRSGTRLNRDIILALTAGETQAASSGLEWLVDKHKDLLDAEIALSGGGEITLNEELRRPLRVGYLVSQPAAQTIRLVPKKNGDGGRPMVRLARALEKVEGYSFPARVPTDLKGWLRASADDEKGELAEALKRAAASAPQIAAKDEAILAKTPAYGWMLRTTCSTASVDAPGTYLFAPDGTATIKCRVLPGDKKDELEKQIKAVIGDPSIDISQVTANNDASNGSAMDGATAATIRRTVEDEWYGVPIVPFVGPGDSESRLLREMGIQTFGIAATAATHKEQGLEVVHGPRGVDERRPTQWLTKTFRWTRELTRELAAAK